MENRLEIIYEAASALFINKGYVRTQIKDIAGRIGLSAGMIYVYFKGKKEILDFILKCTVDPGFMEREFQYPIDADLFEGLSDEIISVLNENRAGFSAPLSRHAQGYPFPQMISDAFDTIARYGTGCLILEKNIGDVGKLGGYYQDYRRDFFRSFMAYIDIYVADGQLRPLKNPELTSRLMIETLAWWGMHVRNDAFEMRKDIPLETAKEICMDNLIHAYLMKGE